MNLRFCCTFISGIAVVLGSNLYVSTHNVILSEAFLIVIEREWFKSFFAYDEEVEFSASLVDMPDLPSWMYNHHPSISQDAFLYGSAEETGSFNIEIIALSKSTYRTAQKMLKLIVQPRREIAMFEAEMKFLNLNVEDMFKSDRLGLLVELFRNHLWKQSNVVYVTKVVSSSDVGGRLPLNPMEKEGVVVRIGGTSDFSRSLQDLEREVQPLRNRIPCPRDYKRTSAEHLFRKRNFITDWCSFHLIMLGKRAFPVEMEGEFDPSLSQIPLTSDFRPRSAYLSRRGLLLDFFLVILLPSVAVGIMSTFLTCMLCFNQEALTYT